MRRTGIHGIRSPSLAHPGRVLVTCEHGGNLVPSVYRARFRGAKRMLRSHRGWDPGALELAKGLAGAMEAPLFASRVTRLLVDLNRSVGSEELLGPRVRGESVVESRILDRHYWPYRQGIEAEIDGLVRGGAAVEHVSVHTFTPVRRGVRRMVDVGLLYDPRRKREVRLAWAWRAAMELIDPRLRVRMNEPYQGTDDGFTTYLRTRFKDAQYAGIEVEVNQRFVRAGGERWQTVRGVVVAGLVLARAAE